VRGHPRAESGQRRAGRAPARPAAAHVFGRLRAQQLLASGCATPAGVVSRLLALQAQNPVAARWAVGIRLSGDAPGERAVERALAEGAILRIHALRWTWQLVCPADARWLLALVSPGLDRRHAPRYRELGLDAAAFRRSRAAIERALRGGEQLTRAELAEALARSGVRATGPVLSHLLARAELQGVLCSGAPRGKVATYALLELRAPGARPALTREEALAELARRYFESRGPATLADLTWWAGLTLGEARAGLEAVRSRLVSEVARGERYFSGQGPGRWPGDGAAPRALLLPAFDEYLLAYRDRTLVLDERLARRINAGGGMLGPCVVVDGRVVGTWRRTLRRRIVEVELGLLEPVSSRAGQAIEAAAARYGEFLGLEARVSSRGRA